jgi:hypothetical protein
LETKKFKQLAYIHGDTIGIERAGGGVVLKMAEEVVVADGVELGVALEAVDRTLALDGVGALQVVVVGEEDLLGAVELLPAADRLLRPIDLHVCPAPVRLDPLDLRHVGRLRLIRQPHEHVAPG